MILDFIIVIWAMESVLTWFSKNQIVILSILVATELVAFLCFVKPHPDQIYAGFFLRVAAKIVDDLLVMLLSVFMFVLLLDKQYGGIIFFFSKVIIRFTYFTAFESSVYKATPGKMLIGIYVVDENWNRLTLQKAILRFFAKYISAIALYIGFILTAFTFKKQALHDLLVKTLVVKKHYELGRRAIIIVLCLIGYVFSSLIMMFINYLALRDIFITI